MDRKERLTFCKKCTLRDFSGRQGIICSLTGSPADFEESCSDFIVDEKMEIAALNLEREHLDQESRNDTLGMSVFGVKNGVLAGFLAIIGAVVWFVASYMNGFIFFYPPILLVIGIITLVKGLNNEKKKAARRARIDDNILDDII